MAPRQWWGVLHDLAGAGGGEEQVVAERTCWEKYTSSPELTKEPPVLEVPRNSELSHGGKHNGRETLVISNEANLFYTQSWCDWGNLG